MAAVKWLRPKSLSGLMLLGLTLIAVPLLIAILNAAIQMRELTLASQELVRQSVQNTRLTRDLENLIAANERTTRLYQVLGDTRLLEVLRRGNDSVTAVSKALRGPVAAIDNNALLDDLDTLQARIRSNSDSAGTPAALTRRIASLQEMAVVARKLTLLGNQTTDAALRQLQERTERARTQLAWQAALLAPLIILAVVLLTLFVARPLGQIDRAISELGRGDFSRDITVKGPSDLERLGGQLEWLRQRLGELAEERSRFLRHMSHELKTPLANIREGTDLLLEGAVGPLATAQHEVASILRDNALRLQRLIENLLSYTAWQSQNSRLELSEFPIRPLIKQVLENQQLTMLSQRLRLEVRADDVQLTADRTKLRLIIDNLLSNAIKYSPKGGTIYIVARAEADAWTLEVADSGSGISPAERERIFDAFYTGRGAPAGSLRGTGIGLSVVMEFVNAHGGTIELLDGKYPGAHFRIRMPIRTKVAPEPRKETRQDTRKSAA
jgi:two-component system sensor histidine kinase GlrK